MTHQSVEEAALRLLRALNERQAHGREDASVIPSWQEAQDAGLGFGSYLYDAAMTYLVDAGALVPDPAFPDVVGGSEPGVAFKLTRVGLGMLEL